MTNTITRKSALETAIARFDLADANDAAIVEVLQKMLDSVSKPRAKSVSPVRSRNFEIANALGDMVANGESISCGFVQEQFADVLTPQKASAILKICTHELKTFERVKVGKQTRFARL